MCGIVGFTGHSENKKIFTVTSHRGPDNTSFGFYGKYTLGHNRLSIIDLNEVANQPFVSEDGNYVIVFNGEVFNFQEIRERLKHKYTFKSDSDTEVILYNYIERGENCLHDFIGMFSFAIYDIKNDKLFCARDRLGIKPFNYCFENGRFIFASEIKAILEVLESRPEVNTEAIFQYLHYLYVPHPNSIYKGIYKLPPGHFLTLQSGNLKIEKYWDVSSFIGGKPDMSEKDILEHLDYLLDDAIRLRMISDVELGSFLSGGIDSSAILYYMNKNSSKPINTFTLGFEGAKLYDERSDARIMSEFFKTNHREIVINPDAAGLLPKMVYHFDEPFGNPTALLIHELTRETRKYATVALAGDGGDEIFGGYPRYEAALLYGKMKFIPKSLIKVFARVFSLIPESSSGNHKYRRIKTFMHSLSKPESEMYEDWISYFSDVELNKLFKIYKDYKHVVRDELNILGEGNLLLNSSIADLKTFLPNNLLAYGDAMSMANSFEVRVPLIDHRIIEFMTSIPVSYRIKNGQTKYLMKKILSGRIPDQIINKPKLGLNPPMGLWLKKDLKNLLDNYLSKESVESRGLFNYPYVKQIVDENTRQIRDRSLYIWSLIVLEEWFRQNVD